MSGRPAAPRGLSVLALLLLVGASFAGLAEGRVLFERDVHLWFVPLGAVLRRALEQGLPLWDDSRGFGQPLLAHPQVQACYPPAWLLLPVPPEVAPTLFALQHLLLGACGVRHLARRLGAGGAPATFAGALWAVSGPALSSATNGPHLAGAAWMGWVLAALEGALAAPGARTAARLAVLVGLQWLAGSADLAVLTLLLGAGLVLARLDRSRPARDSLRSGATVAAGVALGLALAAPQWAPTAAVALRSTRGSMDEAGRTFWSASPLALADAVLPLDLSRLPLSPAVRASAYPDGREPFLASLYLGLGALPLLAAARRFPDRRAVTWLAACAALAAAAALGPQTPAYRALVAALPPLGYLRYPVKAFHAVALCWAVLAGLGLAAWPRGDGEPRRSLLALAVFALTLPAAAWAAPTTLQPFFVSAQASGAVLAGLAPRWLALGLAAATAWALASRSPSLAAAALAAAAVLEPLAAHRALNALAPVSVLRARPFALQVLAREPLVQRVYAYDYVGLAGRSQQMLGRPSPYRPREGVAAGPLTATLAAREQLLPLSAAAWGLRYGYDLDLTGLYPREVTQLNHLLRVREGAPEHLRLLRLGAVSHVVSLHPLADLEPLSAHSDVLADPVLVSRVPAPLARVRLVAGTRGTTRERALADLLAADFDPAREVLLEDGATSAAPEGFAGRLLGLAEQPGSVAAEVEASHPAQLVVADTWDPDWTATVDGAPVMIRRANAAFRAVAVPPGRHHLQMRYAPRAASVGLGTALGAVVVLAAWVGLRRATAGAGSAG